MLKDDEIIIPINFGMKLIQKKDGLTFGSDAFLLASYVRRQSKAKAADLGSGTGVIPLLMLAKDKSASVDAYELQPDFAELIDRNAEENHLTERLSSHCIDMRELPSSVGGRFDVVTANPPYMNPSGKKSISDRRSIARQELFGGIGDFCRAASRLLRHGGLFYVVFRPDRLTELVCALTDNDLAPKRMTFVHARAELTPCLVLIEAKKGASQGTYVTPPLIMYKQDTEYTPELERIYETGDFDEHYQRP